MRQGTCQLCGETYRRTHSTVGYCTAFCRLLSKISKDAAGCWVWTSTLDRKGYGSFSVEGRHTRAHRTSYEFHKGAIPEGLDLDHLCRNRACVNPDHLEPVTSAENTRRGYSQSALNAQKTHCVNGHEFSPENTYARMGRRSCRACNRDCKARSNAKGAAL